MKYKSYRIIDKKAKCVIVDETGNVTNRYPNEEDLKGLKKEPRQHRDTVAYTDKELLDYPKRFAEKYGRIPTQTDFLHSSEYPSFKTYCNHFGSWNNALKLVGLDLDTRTTQGYVQTTLEKARHAEIKVVNHFEQYAIDLAEGNCNSPCDGICPNGKSYDVKSSKFYMDRKCYIFSTDNKYKEEIELYYFLAFNEDYTRLMYVWRVQGEIIEKDYFYVSTNNRSRSKFTVGNMKEYDIIAKFNKVINEQDM